MNILKAEENNFENFLFYDIEVFAEDAIVVFKDINSKTVKVFHNNFDGLREFISGKVLVGYNNYNYDDYILTAMMRGDDVYKIKFLNDSIIQDNLHWNNVDADIFSLDCFQQINVAKSSLKKVEANIGLSIDESKVDFNIDRKLRPDEVLETIKYCKQDVNATVNVFKLRWKSYFVPKIMIVKMLPKEIRYKALRWNTTTITAHLLTGNVPVRKWEHWQLGEGIFDNQEMLFIVPSEVADMWQNHEEKKKYTHHDFDCAIEFSQGGLHGVPVNGKKKYRDVKLLDVTSLYPNILIKLNALGTATTERYKNIVEKRIKVKHTDPVLSSALKLVINSTYGLMKNEYSKLYNPMGALSVCIFGQIALYDLCQRLYAAGYTLININTDGVAFCGGNPVFDIEQGYDYEVVWREWEEDYGLTLELSEFDTWIQKDVNNYVAEYKNGGIKVKGAEVNHYFDPIDYVSDPLNLNAGVNWTGTNTKGIINKCIVNKLLYNTDFVDTIVNNLDHPILFQYVLQCGNTYLGTFDENGKQYQKVNRVFATQKGITLKKKKEGYENLQYFPNAPEEMYLYNGDLRDFDNFKDIVDVDFYSRLAREKYEKLWV